jgi:tetratricopeptide (TPR) repeat protein
MVVRRKSPLSKPALGAVLILGMVAAVYIPAMKAGFVWDDDSMLTQNIVLKPNGLHRSWFTTEQPNYWPITWTSYWIENKLWGLNPTGYHLTNILIHALCAILIWRILRRLKIPWSLPIALVFAVHPVAVESVAWISQRKTILAMLFFLISLLTYLKFEESRSRPLYGCALASFVLALLSKGSVVGLPVVLLLCAWWRRGRIQRRDIVRSLPFFAASAVMSAVEIWFQVHQSIGADVVRGDGLLARAAGAGTAVWFYILKTLWPARLIFVYPRWQIDPAKWFVWIPDLALVALAALGWRFRSSWGKPVLFALGYCLVMLLPILGFFNVYFMRYSLVADHYQYVSMIGVIALAAAAMDRLAARFGGGGSTPALLVVAGLVVSLSCAAPPKVAIGPPLAELEKKAADAEAQVQRGCYAGFSRAIRIYEDLYAQPAMKKKIAIPYLKALLLKAVREREVGILGHANYQKGVGIIKDNAALQQFLPFFVAADSLSPRTRGIMQDIDPVAVKRVYDNQIDQRQAKEALFNKALAEDYYAYLYAAFFTGYGYYAEKVEDSVKGILARYPDSVLLKYKNAIYPRPDRDRLLALLQADPEFYEAVYHLGELAITEGSLLEAEGHFLKALDGLSESPQVHLYLASIYTATEEFEKSLEYYDRTLALSPYYRDAFLGKGISLSSLGAHKEAIEILKKNIELGFYLIGESYYWMAWNEHALKDDDKAQENIEESKKRLPTNSEVFSLAGTIAFDKGELDRAEMEFLEALKHNDKNADALLSLGLLYGQQKKWPDSAAHYERAAFVIERGEDGIAAKIAEIRNSRLSEERKAKLLAKKDQQLKNIRLTKATAFYDAAGSFFNVGDKARALDLALRAAAHPQFKAKAEELIKQIKSFEFKT